MRRLVRTSTWRFLLLLSCFCCCMVAAEDVQRLQIQRADEPLEASSAPRAQAALVHASRAVRRPPPRPADGNISPAGEPNVRAEQPNTTAMTDSANTLPNPDELDRRVERPVRTELDIEVAYQARAFPRSVRNAQRSAQHSASLDVQGYYRDAGSQESVTLHAFARADALDSKRSHADLRELFYSRVSDGFEWHVGVRRVFWGVNEFAHLVDIINQVDGLEDPDQEDRLGQPMLQWVSSGEWGIVDVFVLPGARERKFPGRSGRFAGPLRVDSNGEFASGAGSGRVDGAARYSASLGNLDIGLAHFSGTAREPRFRLEAQQGETVLVPMYETIDQSSVDAQWIWRDWAFKAEGYTRSGQGRRYEAAVAGFERTFVGALGGTADLGLVVEYLYDGRDQRAPAGTFEHDWALGFRINPNDAANSQLLLGVIVDAHHPEKVWSIEGTTRLLESLRAGLIGRIFESSGDNDGVTVLLDPHFKNAFLDRDDYLQLELSWFF